MRIGGLFEGYGGLTMGVQLALRGGELAWYSEHEPPTEKVPRPSQAPARLLAYRHPGVPNLGDITVVDWSTVEPVDVICGGSPCQDVSTAGRREGMRPGTRSGLWESMREAIAVLRPRLVVWENVRGVTSACAHSELADCPRCVGGAGPHEPVLRALGRVLGDLADLGFDAEWHGLRAADVGAPHGRFRIFVVAQHSDGRGCWTGGITGVGRAVGGRRNGTADATTLEDAGTESVADAQHSPRSRHWRTVAGDGTGATRRGQAVPGRCSSAATDTDEPGPQGGEPAAGRDVPARCAAADSDSAGGQALSGRSGAGESRRPQPMVDRGADWGLYESAIRRWERILGRLAPPPTEPNTKGGRRLSPAFVEWMMGLPLGHVTEPVIGLTRNEQLKLLGNGVVPQQAAEAVRICLARAEAMAA